MAQKVTVSLVDDLDGDKADETVVFSLDGTAYEIDLSSGNAGKLRDVLAEFVEAARKVSSPSVNSRPSAPRRATSRNSREEVRACKDWLRAQGRTPGPGRISHRNWAAFRANDPSQLASAAS